MACCAVKAHASLCFKLGVLTLCCRGRGCPINSSSSPSNSSRKVSSRAREAVIEEGTLLALIYACACRLVSVADAVVGRLIAVTCDSVLLV